MVHQYYYNTATKIEHMYKTIAHHKLYHKCSLMFHQSIQPAAYACTGQAHDQQHHGFIRYIQHIDKHSMTNEIARDTSRATLLITINGIISSYSDPSQMGRGSRQTDTGTHQAEATQIKHVDTHRQVAAHPAAMARHTYVHSRTRIGSCKLGGRLCYLETYQTHSKRRQANSAGRQGRRQPEARTLVCLTNKLTNPNKQVAQRLL